MDDSAELINELEQRLDRVEEKLRLLQCIIDDDKAIQNNGDVVAFEASKD